MKIFGRVIGKRNIKGIFNDIKILLPAEIETEDYLITRLRDLVIFLGSERQKMVESLLKSGPEPFTEAGLSEELQQKFRNIKTYFFYSDFIKDNDIKKLIENFELFKEDPRLKLSEADILTLKAKIEKDMSKLEYIQSYFVFLDYKLKLISVPCKLAIKRGVKLRKLYEEMRNYLSSEPKKPDTKKYRKEDLILLSRTAYRKLEEFSLLESMIIKIDSQRKLTRRARNSALGFNYAESLKCIDNVKKIVADVLEEENRRILGIALFEEAPESVNFTQDKNQIILRRRKSRHLKIAMASVLSIYTSYGMVIPLYFGTSPNPMWAYTKNSLSTNIPKQDVSIPTSFGNLAGWLFKANQGTKIVLITHASGHNKSWEAPLIKMLTDNGYNVIAFDFVGHGENGFRPGYLSFGINESKMVIGVLKYIENLGYTEVSMVGQSQGAESLILAASQYKGKMKIDGISAGAVFSNIVPVFKNTAGNYGIVPPFVDATTRIVKVTRGVDYNNFDLGPYIGIVNKKGIPIFYYWGAHDPMIPKEAIEPITQMIKSTDTVKIYPEGNHTFYYPAERGERDKDVVNFVVQHMSQN